MHIDWFTFGAQIFNFVILLALLKYFLYDRIINVMDERKKNIAHRIEAAEQKSREAEKERSSLEEKKKEIESERETILEQARKEAADKRDSLLHEAKKDIDNLRNRWYASLESETESFLRDVREQTAKQVYRIVGRVLEDLAQADLEAQVVEVFIDRIKSGKTDNGVRLNELVDRQKAETVVVRSAFELNSGQRQRITRIVHELMGKDMSVEYQTEANLVLGIGMQLGSSRIQWNAADYLESLEDETRSLLKNVETKKTASSEWNQSSLQNNESNKANREQ